MKPLSFLILASCLSNVLTETPSRLFRLGLKAWNFSCHSSAAYRRFDGQRCDALLVRSRAIEAESTAMRTVGVALFGAAAFAAHAAELPPRSSVC